MRQESIKTLNKNLKDLVHYKKSMVEILENFIKASCDFCCTSGTYTVEHPEDGHRSDRNIRHTQNFVRVKCMKDKRALIHIHPFPTCHSHTPCLSSSDRGQHVLHLAVTVTSHFHAILLISFLQLLDI
jgi:hypothetical protein